jgi:hypothetical protein
MDNEMVRMMASNVRMKTYVTRAGAVVFIERKIWLNTQSLGTFGWVKGGVYSIDHITYIC